MIDTQRLAEEFCKWPLPQSVCSDVCATNPKYQFPRSGTNLLTVAEAKAMFDHLVGLGLLSPTLKENMVCMGVGDGGGRLFVYGSHDSIKAAQATIFEVEKLRAYVVSLRQERDEAIAINNDYVADKRQLATHITDLETRSEILPDAGSTPGALAEALRRTVHERNEATAENMKLRAALANSKDPCAYCSLSKEDWAKCQSGFPGCARADDAMGCPELGAMLELDGAKARIAELEKLAVPEEKRRSAATLTAERAIEWIDGALSSDGRNWRPGLETMIRHQLDRSLGAANVDVPKHHRIDVEGKTDLLPGLREAMKFAKMIHDDQRDAAHYENAIPYYRASGASEVQGRIAAAIRTINREDASLPENKVKNTRYVTDDTFPMETSHG